MAYADGGFYFLQPVGSGYGAITLRNRGYGAARPSFGSEKLSVADLTAILAKAKAKADSVYVKMGTLPFFSKERADMETAWRAAFNAYNTLVHMRDSAKRQGTQWHVSGLPSYTREVFGAWIKASLIDPRYADLAEKAADWRSPEDVRWSPRGGGTRGGVAQAGIGGGGIGGGGIGGGTRSSSSSSSSAPVTEPVTTMGAQPVATEAQKEVAQEQAALRQDVADTVASAGSPPPAAGAMGFLSTTPGKIAAVAVVGGLLYLWDRRKGG